MTCPLIDESLNVATAATVVLMLYGGIKALHVRSFPEITRSVRDVTVGTPCTCSSVARKGVVVDNREEYF